MIKWFVYIVFLLVFTPCLLLAKVKLDRNERAVVLHKEFGILATLFTGKTDTTKTNKSQAKPDTKVKEVAKAKKQPKPEKVDETGGAADTKKTKPKSQRRPDGMERPPEIPRRNDN